MAQTFSRPNDSQFWSILECQQSKTSSLVFLTHTTKTIQLGGNFESVTSAWSTKRNIGSNQKRNPTVGKLVVDLVYLARRWSWGLPCWGRGRSCRDTFAEGTQLCPPTSLFFYQLLLLLRLGQWIIYLSPTNAAAYSKTIDAITDERVGTERGRESNFAQTRDPGYGVRSKELQPKGERSHHVWSLESIRKWGLA